MPTIQAPSPTTKNRIPEWRKAGLTLDITMPKMPQEVSIYIWDHRTGSTKFVAAQKHPDLEACLTLVTPQVISYLSRRG